MPFKVISSFQLGGVIKDMLVHILLLKYAGNDQVVTVGNKV